jgi:hypothetical protein
MSLIADLLIKYFTVASDRSNYSDILSVGQPSSVSEAFAEADRLSQSYTPSIIEDMDRQEAAKSIVEDAYSEPAL